MADWRDGLTPLTDWRKDLAPQSSEEAATGTKTTMRDLAGSASNVIGTGTSGAQIGAMFGGVPGGIAGGVLGGAAGLLLPPSETPGTDLGATAGDLISSMFLRGVPGGRLARAAKDVIATGLGAAIGATGDKALGFQKETPWGNVAFYSAMATPGAIVGSLAAKQSPIAGLAEKFGIPLSVAETTGSGRGLESMLIRGTNTAKNLGMAQTEAAQTALSKIIGAPVEDSLGIVLNSGIEGQKAAKESYNAFSDLFVKQGTKTTTKQVPSGVMNANGSPVMRTVTETIPGPKPSSADFEKAFNLTPEEAWGFRQFVRERPDTIVESLVPKGENQVKGLLNLRATMSVLDQSGYSEEAGKLGQALMMRYLREPFAPGVAVSGTEVAKRIEFALGNASEPGAVMTALGPERAQALRELAEVLKDINPIEKVAKGSSQGAEGGSYLFNKIAFTTASLGAGALAGGGAAPLGSILVGAAGGGIVGIGIPTLIGMTMASPKDAKLLLKAAKGDSQSIARFIRTIVSSAKSESDRDGLQMSDFDPRTRLSGLFSVK